MIGITGVTGELGPMWLTLADKKESLQSTPARSPERAKVYASAEIRK